MPSANPCATKAFQKNIQGRDSARTISTNHETGGKKLSGNPMPASLAPDAARLLAARQH